MADPVMSSFLGHEVGYWLELRKRFETEQGYRASELLEEVVALRGKLAFCEVRIQEMTRVLESWK